MYIRFIVEVFSSKNKSETTSKDKSNKELYETLVVELLVKNLELDNGSVEWVDALTRVALGDESGVEYIWKVYDISSSKVNIYKSICASDEKHLAALFDAISDHISIDLCRSISKLLNGDSDAIVEIIIRQIRNITRNSNILEENLTLKEKLQLLVKKLFSWTEGSTINSEILASIFK